MTNEERLLEQYAEIATLAGGLAHEIRNPLSTVSLNLDLLAEDLDEPETPRERRMLQKVQLIQKECVHLEDVLTAFLEFARVGELNRQPQDLNALVLDFIEFYTPQAEESQIEISPHLDPNLPPVLLDERFFRQVLMNMAINAQQAMPDGGLLELQTRVHDGLVQIHLIDTGAGIDENTVDKIFQAFFSTKRGGSGLGLPTVRKIIEAHQGRITCQSELGRGTRFTISLPPAGSEHE